MYQEHPRFLPWFLENLEQVEGLLLDLDGTLVRGPDLMPHAKELLDCCREHHVPFLFLTNDGNNSPQQKQRVVARSGLQIDPSRIVSCAHAIEDYVEERGLRGREVFLMGDLGVPCYAAAAGLRPTRDLDRLQQCTGVIMGEENYDWHEVMNPVFNYFLDNPLAFLLVPNPDLSWPLTVSRFSLGSGALAGMMQTVLAAHGVKPDILFLGKPCPRIFRRALRQMGREVTPERVLMLGDSLRGDVAGANAVGLQSALILTGITTREKLEDAARPEGQTPHMVFETL